VGRVFALGSLMAADPRGLAAACFHEPRAASSAANSTVTRGLNRRSGRLSRYPHGLSPPCPARGPDPPASQSSVRRVCAAPLMFAEHRSRVAILDLASAHRAGSPTIPIKQVAF
jgi:hypothetical protein